MEVTTQMLEEKKKLYEHLQREYDEIHYKEELFRVAIGLAKHSVSVVDIAKHTLRKTYYNTDWIGGVSELENVPESIIAQRAFHEDSVEVYRNMFADIYAGTPAGSCVVRAKDNKGIWVWLKISYKTLFDAEKCPVRAICYTENVTKKREAERMFEQFIKIVHGKSDFSYQANLTQDKIMTYSEVSAHTVGMQPDMSYTNLHQNALDNVEGPYRELVSQKFERLSLLQKFYEGEREVVAQYEFKWPGTTQPVWMEAHMYLLMNTDGEVYGILAAHNIEAEKISEQEKSRKAQYDQLCPVLKRDCFEAELQERMAQKCDVALMMMDVDKFKHVNDTFGHTFGDEVLVRVAETINGSFRKTDRVGRYGGDEFCVMMVGKLNPLVLQNSGRLLIERVKNLTFSQEYSASLSVGAVQWNGKDSMKELFAKADRQLYEAKTRRGCCSLWVGE